MKNHSTLPKQNLTLLFILIMLIFASCSPKQQEDPEKPLAQWRGENRDGIYQTTDLLNQWPENGPDLLWSFDGIGKGYAAPAVTSDKIFVNGETDSLSFLFAFDLQGNLLWKAPNGKEFMGEGFSATYPGSRSTPTVVGNLVYASSGMGRVACFDSNNGMEIWAKDIIADLKGLPSMFGYSESLVVYDDKVFCFPGGSENNTVALNRFTGEIIWTSDAMLDTFSYCSPFLAEYQNQKILLTHSRHHLYTIDCNTGNLLASYEIPNYEYDGEHCNTPVLYKNSIYFVGNEKQHGAIKINMEENDEKLKEVWRNASVKNNFNGFVVTDDKVFSSVKGNWLKALDIETGAVTDSVNAATGSLIYCNNKFICYGMNGDVNLIENNQGKLNIISSFKITHGTGHHFAHPVINNGVLYLRHGNSLMAYKIGT